MQRWLGWGARLGGLLAVACGGADEGRSRDALAADARTNGLRLAHPSAESLAGGETHEFGGDYLYCPERSSEDLALDDPEVLPWAALAEGHREAPVAWRSQFGSGTVQGFQPRTGVALDIVVRRARRVVFGAAGGAGEPGAGCEGRTEIQLDTTIELLTEDGAIQGTFEHRLSAMPALAPVEGGQLGSTSAPEGGTSYALEEFTGALELGADAASATARQLRVQLVLDAASTRGELVVVLSERAPDGEGPELRWAPFGGRFPDDGCRIVERPVALDAVPAGFLDETPSAVYARAHSILEAAPLAARWENGNGTELTIRSGAATYACQVGSSLSVHGSERLETRDGALSWENPVRIDYERAAYTVEVSGFSDPVPPANFAQATGIGDMGIVGAQSASARFLSHVNLSEASVSGELQLVKWQRYEPQPVVALSWCTPPQCP